MEIITKIYLRTYSVITRILYLLEIFLFLRLLLKFLSANPDVLIIDVVYKTSDILIFPFKFIFPDFYWNGLLVETATISAMSGYILLVYIYLKLLRLFSGN